MIITIFVLLEHFLRQMRLPFAPQFQVPRDIRDKPSDETGDDVNRELKHEHESEASSDHVPVLLVLLIRRSAVKVTTVPKMRWTDGTFKDGAFVTAHPFSASQDGPSNSFFLRTVPIIVTAHTFCASRDTRVSYCAV